MRVSQEALKDVGVEGSLTHPLPSRELQVPMQAHSREHQLFTRSKDSGCELSDSVFLKANCAKTYIGVSQPAVLELPELLGV